MTQQREGGPGPEDGLGAHPMEAWFAGGRTADRVVRILLVMTPVVRWTFLIPVWLWVLPVYKDLFEQLGAMLPVATRMALTPAWRWILGFSVLDVLLIWKEGRMPYFMSRITNILWFLLALALPAILIGVMYLPMVDMIHALE